jgi:hypothetical protein
MAVEEETVIDLLLADLTTGRPGTDSTPSGHFKPDSSVNYPRSP